MASLPFKAFDNSPSGNFQSLMQHLKDLVEVGYPVLLATSSKRLIGNVLQLPVNERMEGTGATVCYGIQQGCHMVRVHDVKEITRMTRMMDVLVGKTKYQEAEN